MTLRLKRRASKIFSMSEGRKSQVILLDDRRLDIIIQPKLYSNDLLDLVASHFKLREKHYFGLGFVDETYHFNWLQGEKRVLDHDFPKKTGLLVLHFAIRFYVETIGLLRDTQTVELFYLNARQAIFRNQIECDVNTVFELAAHVLQASNGDFVSDEETKEELKKLPVIPTSTLKAHPSIAFCEEQVIEHYIRLTGTSRGLAIVNYMTIVEQLPTYGIHYYDVKDKKDIPWWLGISPKGIAVYDKNDKTTPRKLFTWKDLENLYYRDKKFSIEVHGPKREDTGSQVSVSRRTFGASNVDVHAWFASTNQLTKCIWSMAVAQHQFYLDRKQSKSQLPTARSMSEIAADLCRSTTSLPGSLGSDLSRSPSSHSLPSLSNSRYDLTIEQSDSLKAERDMYAALLARREALEDALKKKLEELKAVCLQEGELTGDLPPELPLARGEQPPVFRRRVGTAFSLSVNKVQGTDQLSSELSQLELEVELQGKITSAAQRLASDKTVSKFVRKQRKQSYIKAASKLKEMECKLNDMRKQVNDMRKQVVKEMPPHTSCLSSSTTPTSNRIYQDRLGPLPPVPQGKTTNHTSSTYHEEEIYDDPTHRVALSPSHSSPQLSAGYLSNGGIHSKGSRGHGHHAAGSRNSSDLDTVSSIGGIGSAGPADAPTTLQLAAAHKLDGSHDSGFSSANNMYNINSQRTSHYESTDQLKSPASTSSEPLHSQFLLAQQDARTTKNLNTGNTQLKYSEHFQHGADSVSDGGEAQVRGRNGNHMLHYGSLDRKRPVVNSIGSIVSSGDRQSHEHHQYASPCSQPHYKTEVYRDVSPVRYTNKTVPSYAGSEGDDRSVRDDWSNQGRTKVYGNEPVTSDGIVLEVSVQHQERGRSVPPSSSSSSLSSSTSSYKHPQQFSYPPQPSSPASGSGSSHYNHQTNHDSQQQQINQIKQPVHERLAATALPIEQHCYSPRMYEAAGKARTAYHDVDPSHIHARNVVSAAVAAAAKMEYAALAAASTDGGGNTSSLATAHHTVSQPVFHRQERSISPSSTHYSAHPHQRLTPPSDVMQQQSHPHYHSQPSHQHQIPHHTGIPSPTQQFYSSNPTTPVDSPRSIPIQRVETPPLQNTSSSNPSSPRGATAAAPSALVTISRLNQSHTEVTKPYEISDFYRYSEKLRRQRIIDQYQRQLIGNMTSSSASDRGVSRSSSPQSIDSDIHSSHSGPVFHSSQSHPQQAFNNRSASVPANHPNNALSARNISSTPFYQHQSVRPASPSSHYPEGHLTTSSSSSSYSMKSTGPNNIHYAVQSSSSFHIQQVHSTTAKHSVYTPPQPMACQPIRRPPTGSSDNQKR